jgi:hypothetical protein
VRKVISIPAEPASPDNLPPLLKGFGACPPLVTDIDLSMDDGYLYVACWGTGDLQQYDVSDPFNPTLAGKVRIGGIVSRASHPAAKNGKLGGGPQMVEISRDGRRGLQFQAGPNAPLPFLTHWTQINAKHVAQAAKELGARSLVVSSDLGQSANITHPDGIEVAVGTMKREGIADADIELMLRKNPAKLLGLDG